MPVGRKESSGKRHGLRDQEPVEWIAMVERQMGDAARGRRINRNLNKSSLESSLIHLVRICNEISSAPRLDRNLPDAHCTECDFMFWIFEDL